MGRAELLKIATNRLNEAKKIKSVDSDNTEAFKLIDSVAYNTLISDAMELMTEAEINVFKVEIKEGESILESLLLLVAQNTDEATEATA